MGLSGIDLYILEQLPTQPVLGKHPLDSHLQRIGRLSLDHLLERLYPQAPRVTRVVVVKFILPLVTRHYHLVRIDDDHIISHFLVRSIDGFMLTPQDGGNLRCHPT